MTDYTQAADALKRMAVTYKNIVSVAEALESLGSIEGAEKEAQAALAKARKDRDAFVSKYEQEMAKCKGDLAIAQAAADKATADAKQHADDIKKTAIAAGEKKAAALVEAAMTTANNTMRDASAEKVKLTNELDDLKKAVAAESSKLLTLNAATTEAQGQYDKLDKALSALKAKFA